MIRRGLLAVVLLLALEWCGGDAKGVRAGPFGGSATSRVYLPLMVSIDLCQSIPTESYHCLSVNGPPTDRPAEWHADLNLGLRGYETADAYRGLVDYGVRFVSQYYCFGWAGALVITAVALYACLCTDVLTRLGGGSRGMVLRYVPALLLLVMYGGYHHSLSMILSLLAALSCFALYLSWAPQGRVTVLLLLPVTCAALYHVAGAGSLLFPVLVAILELSIRRRMLVAATALACSAAAGERPTSRA